VISVTLVGQSASEVRRTSPAKGHENESELTFPLAKTGAISTSINHFPLTLSIQLPEPLAAQPQVSFA
jgi:hypothetical protein